MDRRHGRITCGFQRTVVSVLVIALLCGIGFPGLYVSAEDIEAAPTDGAATEADVRESESTDDIPAPDLTDSNEAPVDETTVDNDTPADNATYGTDEADNESTADEDEEISTESTVVDSTEEALECTCGQTDAHSEECPLYVQAESEPAEPSAFESVMAELTALEDESGRLEATEEALDAFYERLMAVWDGSQEQFEADLITADEMDSINEKANAIVAFLRSKYGYENGTISKLAITPVQNGTTLDATVKLFNYTDKVNQEGLGPKGYVFFQGNYASDPADEKEGSVDGKGTGSNTYNKPALSPLLNGGYPYVKDAGNNVEGSMSYLFSKYQVGSTMTNGGGLFQKDSAGYYYYDSALNAAYFNGTGFTLYDTVVRPGYTAVDGTDVQRSNFLPFNPVDGTHATVDTSLSTGVQAAKLNDPVDLWFGMTVEFEFYMPKDGLVNGTPMVFDFHGDDDVFVYIDDVLVLDIGGTHAAQSGTIDFSTGIATDPNGNAGGKTLAEIFKAAGKNTDDFSGNTFGDYTKHTLKFFYMERGGNISYCRLRFNMPTLPKNSLTIAKDVEGYLADPEKAYEFEVKLTDENQNPIKSAKLQVGGGAVQTQTAEDGVYTFAMKAGETAVFQELTKGTHYTVREKEAYGFTATYTDNATGQMYDQAVVVGVTNKLKNADIVIEKKVTGNMGDWKKAFAFTAKLIDTAGNYAQFPADVQLTNGNLTADGMSVTFALRNGETASIGNLPVGTTLEITEDNGVYKAKVTRGKDSEGNDITWAAEGSEDGTKTTAAFDLEETNEKVVFTNHLESPIDTGITTDSVPYILLFGISAAGALLLLNKRKFYGAD